MSVRVLKPTTVTPTPGVQTLKVRTAVAVFGALTGTAKTAQVKINGIRNISGKGILRAVHAVLNCSGSNLMLLTRNYDSTGY